MNMIQTKPLEEIYKRLPPEDQKVVEGVARLLWERQSSPSNLPLTDEELSQKQKQELLKLSGIFASNLTDISKNVDKYLYE